MTKVSSADGNVKLGELLCLKNNIMPFIILDDDKTYYIRGLKEYTCDKMFLTDTIKHEQDLFDNICEKLLNFEIEKDE